MKKVTYSVGYVIGSIVGVSEYLIGCIIGVLVSFRIVYLAHKNEDMWVLVQEVVSCEQNSMRVIGGISSRARNELNVEVSPMFFRKHLKVLEAMYEEGCTVEKM